MEADDALRMEAQWIAQSLKSLDRGGDDSQTLYRLRAYRPRDRRRAVLRYLCPRCFITQELAQNELRCVPGTDEHDRLYCDSCKTEYVIPLND